MNQRESERTTEPTPRLAAARRRAWIAKRTLAYGSAAAFVVAFILARAGHPGQANASSPSPTSVSTQVQEQESEDDDFGFGTGSVAPSTGTPQVQSSVS